MSAEARQRLREAALRNKPWLHTTGPKTPEGKARSAANGRARQQAAKSVRQRRAEFADVEGLMVQMAELRRGVGGGGT